MNTRLWRVGAGERKKRLEHQFSLIELLVTIAVIAVLTSLLLPALNQAREKGKELLCVGNLRQLGTAFSLYVDDHDEYYPPNQSGEYSWAEQLLPYIGKAGIRSNVTEESPKVGRCPNAPLTFNGYKVGLDYAYAGVSFDMTSIGFASGYSGKTNYAVRLSQVKLPSQKCLINEYVVPNLTWNIRWANPSLNDRRFYLFHGRGRSSNFNFCDGSVMNLMGNPSSSSYPRDIWAGSAQNEKRYMFYPKDNTSWR